MKRALIAVGCTLILSATAFAGCVPPATTHHSGSGTSQQCWVLVEVTGPDATANVYAKTDDVKARQEQIGKDNAERAKENKAIDAEVSKLGGELSSKGAKLAASKDDAEKATLKGEIDALKAQIVSKKGEKKPLTRTLDPKQFSARADADKFIEQVYKDVQAAKDAADKKEASSKK